MFYFGYNHKDYNFFLQEYARAMDTNVTNDDTLLFPDEYAAGYFKIKILPNGLQALLVNYTINQDSFINRMKSDEEFYILRFEEIQVEDKMTIHFDEEGFIESEFNRSTAILTSSLFEFGYIVRKGTKVKAVLVIIEKEWLAKYLGIEKEDEVLNKYLSLKVANINYEPLDARYRQWIEEALEESADKAPLKKLVVQNRIMLLVERFFSNLYNKTSSIIESKNNTSNEDIQRLMHVEALLVKDFSVPAPTIPALALNAMMSETKLKNLFKKVYGTGPYAYFQKSRMLKARQLLTSRKYSVKEVGMQLGFQNLSNFTIAFKKEFSLLPSEV